MRIRILMIALLSAMLSSCYATQFGMPALVMVSNEGGVGRSATAADRELKQGRACAESYLGYFAFGDASIRAAANSGGISRIASVSHTTEGTFGTIAKYCTVVRGWE